MSRREAISALLDAPELRPVQPGTRERILDHVRRKPGVSMSQISRALDLHWPIVSYHLKRLVDQGEVVTARVGRRRIAWVPGAARAAAAEVDEGGVLDEPSCLQVARAVVAHPGLTVAALSAQSGISPRMVYHHSSRLIDAGLVEAVPRGRYRELKPSARLLVAMGAVQPAAAREAGTTY